MSSSEEVSQTLSSLKEKLLQVFEEDVDGLCDELDSLHLLSLEEYMDLQYDEDPGVRAEKMIDIILQKGEPASEKFLYHLENIISRFPSLSRLPQFLQEGKKKKFQELLQQLGIKHHLTSKVTLSDILCIGSENLSLDEPCSMKDIPWHFLKNLMALNRTSRNTQLNKDKNNQESNDDNVFDVFKAEHDTASVIHPLDVLCAVLHCSDSFLQQEIVTKLSMCQFAVPLLLPTGDGSQCNFLLWAMRDIVKKWRPQSLSESKGFREGNVVNTIMPIFSFVRLGENKLSKSKTLNYILNPAQQYHNFFIHHDMEGGNIERKISDGLVEMSWYFPCGNSDIFPEPIAVTNLRGDLETNWDQFTFLTRVSSIVFIFIESISESQYKLLSTCDNTDTQYYFIVTPGSGKDIGQETQCFLKCLMEPLKFCKKQIIVKVNNSNDATFVKKIQNILESLLSEGLQQLAIESMKNKTHGLQIDVDENFPACQKARAYACNITSVIRDVEIYKKEVLKLQGDLWKQLSKVEKELCRMTNQGEKNAQQYQDELKRQRVLLQKEQHQHALPDAITLFINAITHLSQAEKQYFLKWMKIELDLIARRNLSALQVEYKEKCNSRSDNPEELKQVDQKIADSSLGIEHFLRELGQFYEAECSMVKEGIITADIAQFTRLPGVATDLLLDGFPLELIDGDSSNIPMKWITDVLTELDNRVGQNGKIRSKLRVITVMGVQSTGKSTLLNTMFGLQFPVASGRCTRGAFMTLLKVKENFQEELGCQFILVIDTEGLKAPELASLEDSYEHDNELATLVVGLSDITIVNMAMENTTEMKDILQIVVHAFLRMKEVGKKPNCQFVHQNVSDVSAYEKNMRDRMKLLEQLDEMTKVAAKMEKKGGITSFNDVLDYNLEKHSWYIPGLWQGVPPMAPVNSGYSENIHKLKQYLFEFMKTHNASFNISEFITWIESLWRAVKHEKFIFSFRNSLVADAYNTLSIQFSLWEWEFSKKVYNFVITTENNIKNQSAESLDSETCEEYRRELCQLVSEEENKMLDLLEKYYNSKSENVHLVERYREDFRMSVQFLRRELERNALIKCSVTVYIQKGKCGVQNIQNQYQKLIEEKIGCLLESGREKKATLSDEEIEQEFESMWEKTLADLQIKKLKRRNVYQAILHQLRNDLSRSGSAIHEQLKNVNLENVGQFGMCEHHIDYSFGKRIKNTLGFQNKTPEMLEKFAFSLIEMCKKYMEEKVTTAQDYDNTHCQELLQVINKQLESNCDFPYTIYFELDIKLTICGKAAQMFQKMHDAFIKNNDPTACLENLKPQYLSTFLSIFQEKDENQNRARQFCERCLKPAITDYVFKHLGEKMVDDILNSSDSITFSSRSFFQCNILEELLEEMSFPKYVKYIQSCKGFSKTWILGYISKKYNSPTTLEKLYQNILSSIKVEIQTVLEEKCLESQNISSFLENVCGKLRRKLVIPQNEMKVITFYNTAVVEQFSSDVQHFLTETEQQILTELRSLDIESVLSKVLLKPQDELCRKVVGCGKQCPFCKVPCEAGGGDHTEHFSSIHRPQGLGRYRSNTDETLTIDICSTDVVSQGSFSNSDTNQNWHPYKEYRTYYPDWAIQPDPSIESSDYWKYIFVKFNQKFAEEYWAKSAELPKDWKKITKEQALGSLKKVFNMN
ncbi:up-regulator of cell proliferation-like [Rana temporaria]|uniref:up-regulator of cell proliferation-like n=1 Tax=Rana temporaria TaxID=8407 RepID=UPI001AACCC92|nr:up-regulator of cell proliferation-like [Rana temporaria]